MNDEVRRIDEELEQERKRLAAEERVKHRKWGQIVKPAIYGGFIALVFMLFIAGKASQPGPVAIASLGAFGINLAAVIAIKKAPDVARREARAWLTARDGSERKVTFSHVAVAISGLVLAMALTRGLG